MDRTRLAVATTVAIDLVYAVVVWPAVAPVNDYAGFVAGGKALLAGQDPYDASSWRAFALAVGQRPDTDVFGYPPWVAIFFVPLGVLPTLVGSAVWTAGGTALAALAMAALARRHGWPAVPGIALALASWPALLQIVQGQWGFVLLALAVLVLLDLERRRDARAGAWWALALLAKPQLFVLASAVLAAWAVAARRPRVLAGAIGTAAAAVAAGTLVAPHWLGPYLLAVLPARASRALQQPTLAGLSGDVAGDLWPVAWIVAVAACGALVAWSVARAPREEHGAVALFGVLALSVAASPYSWSYDHYLAVPLGAAAIAVSRGAPGRTGVFIAAAVATLFGPLAFVLFESAYLRWHDTLAGLVPVLALAAAAAAVAWRSGYTRSNVRIISEPNTRSVRR